MLRTETDPASVVFLLVIPAERLASAGCLGFIETHARVGGKSAAKGKRRAEVRA